MKRRGLWSLRILICFILVLCFPVEDAFHNVYAYVRPKLYVEQGSPIQSTKYPDGEDVILDYDDFISGGAEQYYEARGFNIEYEGVSKDEVYADAYTTVFPSLVLKAELGDYNNAIRSFFIKGSEIYICQEYDSIEYNGVIYTGANVLLSRCKIKGDSFSRKDSMLLTNVGNAATLEGYKYFGGSYFLIGCGANVPGEKICFSRELGRIKYKPGTVLDSESIERMMGFPAEETGDRVKYVEAALSSDKDRLIIHKRSFYGKDNFSVYDFHKINDMLSSSKTGKVSVKNSEEFNDAFLFEFTDPEGMPVSVKGLELSNEKKGTASIYISSGNDAFDERLLKLYRYDSNGDLKGQLIVSDLGLDSVWGGDFRYFPASEINGLRIRGNALMIAFRDLNDNDHQLILSVQKETMKKEGRLRRSERTESDDSDSEVKYSIKKGTLMVSGKGSMDRIYAGDSRIKKVVIEEGITAIPENAFWGCKNLTSVVLPKESLRRIGSGAFAATSLTEIFVPESVCVMGYGAINTDTLKSITLPCDQFGYIATGKASENYPCSIGSGEGCTIRFRYDPEETNVMEFLNAERIMFGDYEYTE